MKVVKIIIILSSFISIIGSAQLATDTTIYLGNDTTFLDTSFVDSMSVNQDTLFVEQDTLFVRPDTLFVGDTSSLMMEDLQLFSEIQKIQERKALKSIKAKNISSKNILRITPPTNNQISLDIDSSFRQNIGIWIFSTKNALMLSQTSFTDWAAGGDDLLAFNTESVTQLNYLKSIFVWNNEMILNYGGQFVDEQDAKNVFTKSSDRLFISSSVYRKFDVKWSLTGVFNIDTQFTNGYDNSDREKLISAFMAPGYVTIGLGLNYARKEKFFSIELAPVSSKTTFVLNQELANQGAFGVEGAVIDEETGAIIKEGRRSRSESGVFTKITKEGNINNIFNYSSTLTLFSAYKHIFKTDVRWEFKIESKISKYFSVLFDLVLIYDDDIKMTDNDGNERGPSLQVKQYFGVGLSYAFP